MNISVTPTQLIRMLFCMLLLPLGATPPAVSTAQSATMVLPEGFTEDPAIEGFDQPIAFDWASDGRLFVGEKGGSVRVVKHGALLQSPAVAVAVNAQYDRGLLGLVVDPLFPQRPYLYLYYTAGPGSLNYPGRLVNRVSRFTATDDNGTLASEFVLVDNIDENAIHNGGDLHFGPDGMLYVSTGDGGKPTRSQDLESMNGKILRVDPLTGLGVPDNPFYDEQASPSRNRVWALGLRNPHRFAIHPTTGEMMIGDVGQATYEELNRGRAGANYGWPVVEGPEPAGVAGMTYPLFTYMHGTNPDPSFNGCPSIAAGPFLLAGQLPTDYAGAYFFADTFCKRIWYSTPGSPPKVFVDHTGNAVHLAFSPDGTLYYSDFYSGRLRRISHQSGNRAPLVAASANVTSGPLPLEVQFSYAGTHDPDGDELVFSWDFGDGNSATTADARHTYSEAHNYEVVLTVQDIHGASARSVPITIFAGNIAPQPVITSPENSTHLEPGQTITLQGSATDSEDGALPEESLNWTVFRHHGTTHKHPWAQGTGSTLTVTMPNPEDLATAGISFLEARLTAVDSRGARTTETISLRPNPVELTFQSDPSGLRITLDGTTYTAPVVVKSVKGWSFRVAVASQFSQCTLYRFQGWSNHMPSRHTFTTPDSATTTTANMMNVGPAQCLYLPIIATAP